VIVVAGCRGTPPARHYELRGQVLVLRPGANEITIRHEDIKDFMPAMTMPFKVRDKRLLEGWVAGDLIQATLVVGNEDAFLSSLTKTGHAEVVLAPAPPAAADLVKAGDAVPDESFVDQDGHPVSLSSFAGRAVALTFIYTRCPLPDFCPLMDRQFAAIQERVTADGTLRGSVHLLSITFDPEFDTPAVLRGHARRVGANPATWSLLTGDHVAIDRFAAALGLSVIRETDGPGGIAHNLRTAVLDRAGRLVTIYSGNDWTPDQVLTSLRQAVSSNRD
jgi:protein SCO1/2